MGGRYLRKFDCDDCGTPTERMWQGGRPRVCYPCGHLRWLIATNAAHDAIEQHKRAMRLELAVQRAVRLEDAPDGLRPALDALEAFSEALRPPRGV